MGTLKTIYLSQIKVKKGFNARKNFDKESLRELGQSITANGLIQPLVVTQDAEQGYYLVVGERRYRAAKMAKIDKLPCVVEELSQNQALQFMNIENLQREDLSPLEEADGISKLIGLGMNVQQVADQIGCNSSKVYARNKLNFLIDEWKQVLAYNGIYVKDGLALARLSHDTQKHIYDNVPHWAKDTDEEGRIFVQSNFISNATDISNNDLSKALFNIEDENLIENATACLSCTLRSSCNPVLFPSKEENNTDLCLNVLCFQEKETKHLSNLIEEMEKNHDEFLLLSTNYWSNTDGVYGTGRYDKAKKSDEGALPGLIIEGEKIGKTMYVTLCTSSSSGPMTEEQKAERKRVIRDNKIKKLEKSLVVSAVADAFKSDLPSNGDAFIKVLDFLIADTLCFGQSKEFIEYFTERYDWKMEVDYQDHQGRREAIKENITATPADDKLRLFIDAIFKMKTVSEWDDSARTVAKTIKGIDSKGLLKEATRIIDEPKKRKKKGE